MATTTSIDSQNRTQDISRDVPPASTRARDTQDAKSYLEDERFSRKFEIPAQAEGESTFIVTYADFGYRDVAHPENERALLFCSPLMGSRFLHVAKDELAKKYRVRMIIPDRPGFGRTTNVDVQDRISTWLRIVPALLQHLNIEHVSLAAHSGGAIYALSTILYLRDYLHPTQPYVALCAPWIHPSHSGAPLSRFLEVLPIPLVNQFDSVERFLNTSFRSMIGFSSGLSAGLGFALKKSRVGMSEEQVAAIEFEEMLMEATLKRIHQESVEGLNSDALLLLKRGVEGDVWGEWEDVDRLVPMLAIAMSSSRDRYAASAPLSVEAFFAESDSMIGTDSGPKWFDECWRPEQRGELIDYSSRFVEGTDHDNIMNIEFGVAERIFSRIPQHGE